MQPIVDVIIPCYMERQDALQATINGCLNQTLQPRNIYVVDDGSPDPVSLPISCKSIPNLYLIRQEENRGISAARNVGASHSDADYLLFLNCEILLSPTWIATTASHMQMHSTVGATCGRLMSRTPHSLLTAWAMRFQTNHEERGKGTHEVSFATGHAVLVRRSVFVKVNGYDSRYQRTHEDSDLCRRLRALGFLTYYVGSALSTTMQRDTLRLLAQKAIRHTEWSLDPNLIDDAVLRPLIVNKAILSQNRSLMQRLVRNIGKGRLYFVHIDFLVWAMSLWLIVTAEKARR